MLRFSRSPLFLLCLFTTLNGFAQFPKSKTVLAARPPMGWNNWDAYGLTITFQRKYDFYNLPANSYASRDLWMNTDRGASDSDNITLQAHA